MNEYKKYILEKWAPILNSTGSNEPVILVESQETPLIRNVKIYLDDLRNPTQTYPQTKDSDWIIVRNYDQFREAVVKYGNSISELSFDNDLGFETLPPKQTKTRLLPQKTRLKSNFHREKTGYDCAKFLVDYCLDKGMKLPQWKIHSMNPVGRKNIEGLLLNFEKNQSNEKTS